MQQDHIQGRVVPGQSDPTPPSQTLRPQSRTRLFLLLVTTLELITQTDTSTPNPACRQLPSSTSLLLLPLRSHHMMHPNMVHSSVFIVTDDYTISCLRIVAYLPSRLSALFELRNVASSVAIHSHQLSNTQSSSADASISLALCRLLVWCRANTTCCSSSI